MTNETSGGPWPYVFCITPMMQPCMPRPSPLVQPSVHAKQAGSGQETLGRHVHPCKIHGWNLKNKGLEDDFPFQTGDFQVPC